MNSRLVAVMLLAFALAACDGQTEPEPAETPSLSVDEEAWKSDLATELGRDDFDFGDMQELAAEDCEHTFPEHWIHELTNAGTGDTDTADVTRINLRHACPDVLVAYEAAWSAVHDVPGIVDELCSTPLEQLTLRDRLNAQGIC